jgi:hypothetical protein
MALKTVLKIGFKSSVEIALKNSMGKQHYKKALL